MEVLVIVVLVALAAAAAAPAFYAWRRRLAQPGELELWQVLARRGVSPSETAQGGRPFAAAMRRCALCTNVDVPRMARRP
jgi:hypothetical protein